MNLIKDIIWDFDGTLFDTYPGTVEAFNKSLKEEDIEETNEAVLNCFKVSERYAISHFKELYGLTDKLVEKYKDYKRNIELDKIKPFPYAVEVCRQISELGSRNYIYTHRGDSTLQFLQHYGMMSYFTEVITKKYGFKRKPDPEGFNYLIEKYQLNRIEAMVIGDRECEIVGGKSVGIKTCLYNTNNISLSVVPDYSVDSLKNLIYIINI